MKINILENINKSCEKRLEIAFPPPITSYLPYSVITSIITAQENSLNWIYNNFIQIYHKGIGKVDYYPNSSLPKYLSNFPYFTGFSAHSLVK